MLVNLTLKLPLKSLKIPRLPGLLVFAELVPQNARTHARTHALSDKSRLLAKRYNLTYLAIKS